LQKRACKAGRRATRGLWSKLDGGAVEAEPAKSAPAADIEPELRPRASAEGVAAGRQLARERLIGESTVRADATLLFGLMLIEIEAARSGSQQRLDRAVGRAIGYLTLLDDALDAARAAGVKFTFGEAKASE
jgi:hypothetical protein